MTDLEYLKKYYKGDINDAIKRLESGEAVQYIVGNVDFLDFNFNITHDTLMPRFETEELVYKLIKRINDKFSSKVDILDIGTGTGCIAITLANKVSSNVVGVDISLKALEVANKNNRYENKVNFILSDIFSNVEGKFDVIVSNPPYIRKDETVMDIVLKNEPSIALYAPNNGLYFYEEILKNAANYLKDEFIIAFEIGSEQASDIISIANKYFSNVDISLEKDMQKLDRFIFITSK